MIYFVEMNNERFKRKIIVRLNSKIISFHFKYLPYVIVGYYRFTIVHCMYHFYFTRISN